MLGLLSVILPSPRQNPKNLKRLKPIFLSPPVVTELHIIFSHIHCVIGSFSTSSEDLYCNKIGSEAFLIFYTLNEQSFSKIICRPLLLRIIMTPLTTATIRILLVYLLISAVIKKWKNCAIYN